MTTNLANAMITLPNTTASRTLGSHFNTQVNVMDFGAKGDGVTDDTTAIQNAVNYACANGLLLIWPASVGAYYVISSQILVPWGTYNWAIRGAPHRVNILQKTDNTPFLHFDSLSNNPPSGVTNSGFDVCNFSVQWTNNQPVTNTHSAVVEFNNGGWFDYVIENIECVNGVRGVTLQYPGQTVGRPLNAWGCIYRHIYMAFSSTGSAIHMRSNPVEGNPNILIQHVYSVQNQSGEELIHLAGCTSVVIETVEQNFCSFLPAFVGWANTGNVSIIGWRCESFQWLSTQQTSPCLFSLNGANFAEYIIHSLELRNNTINLPSGDCYIMQTSGARVQFHGFMDTVINETTGNINLIQLGGSQDSAEIGLQTFQSPNIKFCSIAQNTQYLSQVHFTGGSHRLEFYKNALTTNMSAVINDSASNIKGQIVAEAGWIWSLRVDLDAAISGGSVEVQIFKNGALLDSGTASVNISSGATATFWNQYLKNVNHPSYQVFAGDLIDVRTTTGASLIGPTNLRAEVVIATI